MSSFYGNGSAKGGGGDYSDAEVIDARNGYDGTTYDTLGTAIRTQVSELKGDKIDKPTSADNNKFPRAKDGDIEWVEQGPQGEKGEKGDKGDTGADGYSPSASVVRGEGKATITITDKKGTTSADVFDGQENAIETVKVNGEALPIQDKAVNIDLSDYAKSADVNKSLGGKVDKAEGMGLSQNSYTTAEKTKLSGIAEGANRTTVTASAETLTITINADDTNSKILDIIRTGNFVDITNITSSFVEAVDISRQAFNTSVKAE